MKNKTKNTIIVLSIVTLLLITTLIYFKIDFNKNIQIIIEAKKNNFLISEKIHTALGIKNKIKEVKDVEESFDDFFVDKNKVLGFIENIEKIAETNNVTLTIDNVTSDESHLKESLPYGLLKMTLVASGNFNSVNNFMTDVENLPYYIEFGGVRMKATEDKSDANWSISVSLNTLTK